MRELSDDAVRYQATALADYIRRGGDPVAWLTSKDLTDDDAYAVRQEWRRLQLDGRSA